MDDVKAKLEQTTAARVQFEQISKAELDAFKAKLEQTTAAKVLFEQTSKTELDEVKAAQVQLEETYKAELDAVKAKLQQTTAAKAQVEQQPEHFQAKFEEAWPASLATGLAHWYACLPFGTGMLVAIALVSHFVEMIAKLVKNDRGGDRFGCYFCILSTYYSLACT